MRKKAICTIVALALCLAACGGVVNHASPDQDYLKKRFAVPPENVSALYIFRDGFLGHQVNTQIFVDGRIAGTNLGYTYLYIEIPPGKHTVTSHFVGYASLDIETEGGRIYFIRDELDTGMVRTTNMLHLVSEAEGKAGVQKCRLAESAM